MYLSKIPVWRSIHIQPPYHYELNNTVSQLIDFIVVIFINWCMIQQENEMKPAKQLDVVHVI